MGSALGSAVARKIERFPQVEVIAGFGLEPPRRWLRRAHFQFAHPDDGERVRRMVADFAPTVVVHAWVFEPRARSSPGEARARTLAGTETLLSAIALHGSVERIVLRSGVSIYGRSRATPDVPTVATPLHPTSSFGRTLQRVEDRTEQTAGELDASMMSVRLAPVMASHLPNPLGRYLRLPIVPVPFTSRRFGVVHLDDAARVLAAAVLSTEQGPVNVMADGPVTPLAAIAIGHRVPLPVLPVALRLGRSLADLTPAPLPGHVAELLSKGQVVKSSNMSKLFDLKLNHSTTDALVDLYAAGRLMEIERSGEEATDH